MIKNVTLLLGTRNGGWVLAISCVLVFGVTSWAAGDSPPQVLIDIETSLSCRASTMAPDEPAPGEPLLEVFVGKALNTTVTLVELSPTQRGRILGCFHSSLKEAHLAFGRSSFPRSLVEELEEDDLFRLVAIRQAYRLFELFSGLRGSPKGLRKTFDVILNLKSLNCGAMAHTVFGFLRWLDYKNQLGEFETAGVFRGNPLVHVATPLVRKEDGFVFMIDAWIPESDGGPKVLTKTQFDWYLKTSLEAWQPGRPKW